MVLNHLTVARDEGPVFISVRILDKCGEQGILDAYVAPTKHAPQFLPIRIAAEQSAQFLNFSPIHSLLVGRHCLPPKSWLPAEIIVPIHWAFRRRSFLFSDSTTKGRPLESVWHAAFFEVRRLRQLDKQALRIILKIHQTKYPVRFSAEFYIADAMQLRIVHVP
jgi:hypothetical protein